MSGFSLLTTLILACLQLKANMAIDKFEPNCIKSVRKTTPILRKHRYTSKRFPLTPTKTLDFNSPERSPRSPFKSLKNKIQFHGKVKVFLIPSRKCYPESIKSSIWSNTAEIKRNARRNSIEFASEGWDWRRALEDDYFYISPNGERIHPVHFQRPKIHKKEI